LIWSTYGSAMARYRHGTPLVAMTVLVVAQLVTACTATPSGSPAASGSTSSSATPIAIPRGGTLRVLMPVERAPRFSVLRAVPPNPAVLDPQKEFLDGFLLLRCCLARTLLSHNGLNSEEGGARLRPDLASALPDIGSDGVTWTFHLKEGIHYGPPLGDGEITAQDFVRAFHRLFTPAVIDVGPFLFGDIEGAADYAAGKAASISGLEVPDPHTLVIRLTRPAGDLGARLAMSLVSPLPPNPSNPTAPFGVAQGHDDGYGRFLVSTGPYMVEGSEKLDFSLAPDAQKPASGVVLGKSIVLVRNPNWDPSSDDLRVGYVDRIELSIGGSIDAALASFDAGNVDVVWNHNAAPVYTPEQIGPYLAGQRNGRVVIDDYDASRGLFLNVAIAPFDDVHVRKAANFAVNKARLVELTGGPAAAEVAGHLVTDSLLDNLLVDYDPYATPGSAGDLEAAKAGCASRATTATATGSATRPPARAWRP
jgi:peptide/nickel transport system substrate-binding protein